MVPTFVVEVAAEAGAKLAMEEAAKRKAALSAFLTRLWRLIAEGRLKVFIFGAGGVGKSTLSRFLAGADLDGLSAAYQESIVTETVKLAAPSRTCIALVGPGQSHRRPNHWPALLKELQEGKSIGVINVGCWGYHSLGISSYRHHRAYKPGMTESEFLTTYLNVRREEELAALREIVPYVSNAKGKLWMVSAITKQDLWWADRVAVQEFYRSGIYSSIISEIAKARGATNFIHEYLSASLIAANLRTAPNEILAATAAGYDEPLRQENLQRMLTGIRQLVESA